MKHSRLDDMTRGWFVGAFAPTAHSSEQCEVAVKKYKAGEYEAAHYHKIATEITLILSGKVRMCGAEWGSNDIITLSPNEVTDFEVLEDTITVVVKTPGALNDKYLAPSRD